MRSTHKGGHTPEDEDDGESLTREPKPKKMKEIDHCNCQSTQACCHARCSCVSFGKKCNDKCKSCIGKCNNRIQ